MVCRDALQRYIIDEARRLAPDAVHFHWGQSLSHLDVASRTAYFQPTAASDSSVADGNSAGTGKGDSASNDGGSDGATGSSFRYGLLVGADGFNSRVRRTLASQVSLSLVSAQQEVSAMQCDAHAVDNVCIRTRRQQDATVLQVPGFNVHIQDFDTLYKCFHRIPNDVVAPVGLLEASCTERKRISRIARLLSTTKPHAALSSTPARNNSVHHTGARGGAAQHAGAHVPHERSEG